MAKHTFNKNTPPLEVRQAMLTLSGFKQTDRICPVCEGRLWYAEERDTEMSLWFGGNVEVETDHQTCPHCGYERILTTATPE